MKTYTRKEIVERIPSLTHRQIQFYTEEGVVKPVETKTGRGNARIYSEENLKEFAIIGHLAQLGMNISVIREVLKARPLDTEVIPAVLKSNKAKSYFEKLDLGCNLNYSLFIFFNNGELQQVVPLPNISFDNEVESAGILDAVSGVVFAKRAGKLKPNLEYDALVYCNISKIIKSL